MPLRKSRLDVSFYVTPVESSTYSNNITIPSSETFPKQTHYYSKTPTFVPHLRKMSNHKYAESYARNDRTFPNERERT